AGQQWAGRVVVCFAVDLLEVFADVALLGDPLVEIGRPRVHDDVGDGARLLALADRPHGLRRVPHVADDARAHGLGEPRPGDEDLARLVVRRLLARVGALGQPDRLPLPLEHRRVLEVDLALDLLVYRSAVVDALHGERVAALVLDDLEVLVVRRAPVLRLPVAGQADGADRVRRPV